MQAAIFSSAARTHLAPSSRSSSPSSSRASPQPSRSRRSRSQEAAYLQHRPSWHSQYASPSRREIYISKALKLRDEAIKLQRHTWKNFKKLPRWQQLLLALACVVLGIASLLFLIFNERIFAWLVPVAKKWKALRLGWLICFFITFLCAFPPIIGYSMSLTLAGFIFGFPTGWFIAAPANILGSLASFLACRYVFRSFAQRLVSSDKRFAILAHTLKRDGFKLLVMLRLCPLPYSLSNGAMATFPTISPWVFMAATAAASPKLLIHIFIGGRIAALAESGGKMDAGTKLINYASIGLGVLFGIATGYIIYDRAVKRAAELEGREQQLERSGSNSSRSLNKRYSERSLVTMAEEDETRSAKPQRKEERGRDGDRGNQLQPYRDEVSDDENDVFALGDGDEEEGRSRSAVR